MEEVLAKAQDLSQALTVALEDNRVARSRYRRRLEEEGLLLHEASLGWPPAPTTCGVDGSYAIERLLSMDVCLCAAVAVEGLTPPSESRHWEEPHHRVFMAGEPHSPDTATVLRSVMVGRELLLAREAPHDMVFLDMTLTLPLIYFNQALNLAPRVQELQSAREFLAHAPGYLRAYRDILQARRTDKQYVGIPKYSSQRELGNRLGWASAQDDRGMMSFLLQAGELTRPLHLQAPDQPWHLKVPEGEESLGEVVEEILAAVKEIHVMYYRPTPWLPALRVEMPGAVATNRHRLAVVVQGLKHQCVAPGILEPYPTYMADRMAKAVGPAMPAFRQVITQGVAQGYQGDLEEVYFAFHGYRTETGR